MFLPIRIKHPLDVAVQRSHDTDPGKHRRPARCRHQDQGLHGCVPLGGLVLGLRQLGDVPAGVLEPDEPAAAGQRDWFIETTFPAAISHRLRPSSGSV